MGTKLALSLTKWGKLVSPCFARDGSVVKKNGKNWLVMFLIQEMNLLYETFDQFDRLKLPEEILCHNGKS